MKIVATTSLPAVDHPDADRWNAARSCQNRDNRKLGAPWGQTDQSLFSNTLYYWQDFVQNTRYLCPLQKMRNIWITHLKNKKNIKRFVYYFSFLLTYLKKKILPPGDF